MMHEEEILGKAYDARLMRRLIRYLKPYRRKVIVAILLTIIISALGPVRPYLTQIAVDNYIAHGDKDGLLYIALLLVASLVLQSLAQYALTYATQWIGQRTINDLRREIFSHVQKLSLRFFDTNPVGRLVTRLTSDVEVLNEMFSSGIVMVFADVFVIVWILIFMFSSSVPLSFVTLSVLPILFFGTFLFRKYVRETYRDVRYQVARMNSYMNEHVTGMSTVQIFGQEKRSFEKFDEINASHTAANIRSIFYYAVFFPAVELLSSIAIGLILWYGGGKTLQGAMTLGTLISFIQYTEQFFRPIRDLSEKYNIMQTAMASSERVFTLLDNQTIIPDVRDESVTDLKEITALRRHGRKQHDGFKGEIEFRNVSFAYDGEHDVLNNVSFTVPAGKMIAIVGHTGAGKSTIINLLSRFYDVRSGEILLDGRNIKTFPLAELRQAIGVVLQDVFLFSGDITTNITLGDETISLERVVEASKMVGADEFVSRLDGAYNAEVKERGATLSVGQRQLLSFARALAFDPKILVLDEATANVDTETERKIQHATATLLRGRTSIVIAHRLSTIQHADEILVMHRGEIRERGSHQELLAQRGIYHTLYELQYKGQEVLEG